jgi:hypothetical protein
VAALEPAITRLCNLIITRLFKQRNLVVTGDPAVDRTFPDQRTQDVTFAFSFCVKMLAAKGSSPEVAARFLDSKIAKLGGVS